MLDGESALKNNKVVGRSCQAGDGDFTERGHLGKDLQETELSGKS